LIFVEQRVNKTLLTRDLPYAVLRQGFRIISSNLPYIFRVQYLIKQINNSNIIVEISDGHNAVHEQLVVHTCHAQVAHKEKYSGSLHAHRLIKKGVSGKFRKKGDSQPTESNQLWLDDQKSEVIK
jgi:hypothetical protein